jgi:cysteine desulfurase/selenocysteine lyase
MQVADRTTALRNDFPILQRVLPNGRPLVYLDNVHRGVHTLSEEATAAFEAAREKVAKFIHAPSARQIVFTRGTTEGINLVAYSWGRANLGPGDEVLITEMEHHANIVPWQIVQEQLGFTLRYVPITPQGVLDLERLPDLLTERTKLFCFVHASNVVGTINPVQELVAAARAVGAKVLIDGAQSVPHMPVDVQALDADFYVFSGHKMCGPTGVGVLYAKRELLEAMPPFMGGGDMIREVKMTGSKWNSVPYKFEAGTPAIAEVIGLGAAVDYLQQVGMEWVHAHEREITRYAYERMSEVEGLRILGPGPAQRGGLIAFTLDGIHPHDVAAILDRAGVAVRAGHHCAQPLHDRLGVHASARASFYLYNTLEEVDVLVEALHHAQEVFAV